MSFKVCTHKLRNALIKKRCYFTKLSESTIDLFFIKRKNIVLEVVFIVLIEGYS